MIASVASAPGPTPSIARPRVRWSSRTRRSAIMNGLWYGSETTPVPSLMCLVTCGGVRDEQHRVADRLDAAGVVLAEPGLVEAHAVEQLDELDVPLQGVGRVLSDRHVVRRQEDAKAHSGHGQPSRRGAINTSVDYLAMSTRAIAFASTSAPHMKLRVCRADSSAASSAGKPRRARRRRRPSSIALVQRLHARGTRGDRRRCPVAGGEDDQRVEHVGVEARRCPRARRGGARWRRAAGRAGRGRARPGARRCATPNATCRASSTARQPGDLAGDRVGRVRVEEGQQVQEAALAEHREQERGQGEVGLGEQACPATPGRPPTSVPIRPPCSSARRVKTSTWRASSAAWTASSCWTSRKCGWTRAEQPGRDDEGGLLVLDQVGHHLDDGRLDVGRAGRRPRPSRRRWPGPTAPRRHGRTAGERGRPRPRRGRRGRTGRGAARPRRGRRGPPAPSGRAGAARSRPGRDRRRVRARPTAASSAGRPGHDRTRRRLGGVRRRGPPRGTTPRRCTPQRGVGARDPQPAARRQRRAAPGRPAGARRSSKPRPAEVEPACGHGAVLGAVTRPRRRRSRLRRRPRPAARSPLVRPACQTRQALQVEQRAHLGSA